MHKFKENYFDSYLWQSTINGEKLKLSQAQIKFITFIPSLNICREIGKPIFDGINDIISNNGVKEYTLLILEDIYSSAFRFNSYQAEWIADILSYIDDFYLSFKKNMILASVNSSASLIQYSNIIIGAGHAVFETIKNLDIHSKPRILSFKDLSTSSAVFFNSKPNATIMLVNQIKHE